MTSPIFERYHVLVVPGWQNSGPEHWQSRWQDAHPAWQRVQQADWLTPSRADWVATLDDAVRAAGSTGIAGGAQPGLRHHRPLGGATPGQRRAGGRRLAGGPGRHRTRRRPARRGRLCPAAARAAAVCQPDHRQRQRPYCAAARADALVRQWGSALTVLPAAGHINTDAGFGPWLKAWRRWPTGWPPLPLAQP